MGMAINSKISNTVSRSAAEEESTYEATETLSNLLPNYPGYSDSDDRKTTVHLIMTGLDLLLYFEKFFHGRAK